MKRIIGSLIVIVAAFYYFTSNYELPTTATAQPTVAASDDSTLPEDSEKQETTNQSDKKSKDGKIKDKPGKSKAHEYHKPAYLTDRPEQIVNHSAMTISWNSRLGVPNYVAWELTEERVKGSVKRADDFQPDPKVADSPTWADYRQSGYDRGHMCPAADNKHSDEAQRECFYMTNMCPQTHTLNAGDWSQLEDLCRRWAKQYGTVYVVSGPIVNGYPQDKHPSNQHIGNGRVIVPDAFFKVVMRRGEYGAKAIGFICENGNQNLKPRNYAVSVDSVEVVTGINFFSKLPKAEERKAEAAYDIKDWKGL